MEVLNRNKRLGQFFSGEEIGKLLAHLSLYFKPDIRTAIDPMLGIGDLLCGTKAVNTNIDCYGIEIDTSLKDVIKNRFDSKTKIEFGNSFNKSVFKNFRVNQYDLVITNPPFVRYQSLKSKDIIDEFEVPSAEEVRINLNNAIESNKSLCNEEIDFLTKMALGYSGLSDLTIPSILLCSSITTKGGILSLVLPESSISREYCAPALATLFKFFDIKVIVKDERRSWFKDVQVKTILLVAVKLKTPRLNILEHCSFPVIEISNKKSTGDMPIGSSFSTNENPYESFIKSIFDNPKDVKKIEGIQTYNTNPSLILNNIISNSKKDKWLLEAIPEFKTLISNSFNKLYNLDNRLDKMVSCCDWTSLDDLNINIGQGLRTGANQFFYVDFIKKNGETSIVHSRLNQSSKHFEVLNSCLQVVLRKQSELPNAFVVTRDRLQGRVLTFKRYYTNTDIEKFKIKLNASKHLLNFSAIRYIEELSKLNIGTKDKPKFIPEMSAVKTNESLNNGTIKRWYQLPPMKSRHLPELCIPRVNSKTVKSFLVESDTVVDANFITVNTTQNSKYSKYALLAIFNSDWFKLNLELNGNVLGGGALKLDKAHINNILIPTKLALKSDRLNELGKELCSSNDYNIIHRINELFEECLKFNTGFTTNDFKSLIDYKLNSRCSNA